MENKFYYCKHCGNIVGKVHDSGVPVVCCGEKMEELVANTVEASKEKHIPVVTVSSNIVTVEVGSVIHPMTKEHHIEWIYLLTKNGGQRKECVTTPNAKFSIIDDEVISCYAYCNLHGLWKIDL